VKVISLEWVTSPKR